MALTVERLVAEVEANPAGAIAALNAFSVATDAAARDRRATITVDADHSEVDRLAAALDNAGGGGRRGGEGISFFSNSANNAYRSTGMLRLVLLGGLGLPAVISLAVGAAGALQTLGAAAVGAASSLASLSGILGAVPVGLAAIVGGIGATIMGFQGIGGAIKASDAVMGSSPISTGQAAGNLRAVEAAARGVENAYRTLAKAQEAVKEAEKDLARTRRDAAQTVADAEEDAARRIKDAREWFAESGERLEDAQFRMADSLISEKEAVLALEAAQKRLVDVQKGVGRSSAQMSRVTDDFTGKTYEVARLSDDAADSQYDQQAAILAVQRAQLALLKAQDRVGDSARDLSKEQEDYGNRNVTLAKAEKDARRDLARAHENAARSIESAEKRVKNAHEGVADALRGVEDAQRSLADAQKAGAVAAAGGAAALNKYNEAMAGLTPAGREFVRFMTNEFLPAWRELQKRAQEGLLPGVQRGLTDFMKMFPMLEGQIFNFAKTMGDHFAEFFAYISTPDQIDELEARLIDLNKVLGGGVGADGNYYKGILDVFKPLYDIILKIIEAATPMTMMLTDDIVRGLENVAAALNTDEGLAKLQGWFERGYHFGGLFMDVLRPMGRVLGDLSEAARPLAEWMLESMAQYFEDLADTTSSLDGMANLEQWFTDMQEPIRETTGLIRDLLAAIFGAPTDPEDSAYLDLVRGIREDVIPEIERLFDLLATSDLGDDLAEFFGNIGSLINTIVEHESALELVLDIFNGISDVMKGLDKLTGGKSTDVLLGLFAGLGALKIGAMIAKFSGLTTLFKGISWLFGLGGKGKHAAKGGILAKLWTGMKKVGAKILPWIGRFAKRAVFALGPIGVAIGLGLVIWDIIKNWDKIKEVVGKALDWLKENIPKAWNWIKEKAGEILDGIVSWVSERWEKITTGTREAWDEFKRMIGAAWDSVYEKVTTKLGEIWEKITTKWTEITTNTQEKWDAFWDIIDGAWENVKTTVSNAVSDVWTKITTKWEEIRTKTSEKWNEIWSDISGVWEDIKSGIAGFLTDIWTNITEEWAELKEDTKRVWDDIWEDVKKVWDDIEGRVQEFIDWIGGIDDDIDRAVSGAFDGFKDAFKSAFNWIIRKWNSFGFEVPEANVMGVKFGGWKFETPDIAEWKQFGGPVEAGKPYIVGEKRAEMFIPSSSGRIASAVPRTQYGEGDGGGGISEDQMERLLNTVLDRVQPDVDIEQNFYEKADPLRISRAVARTVKSR